MRVTEARGEVISAFTVDSGTDILVFSSAGNIVRMGVDEISEQGRDATGVRVARLDEGDTVVAVAKVLEAEQSDETLIDGDVAIDGVDGLEDEANAEPGVLDEPGSASEGEEN
jgi:DNA gyrase subunit A